MMRNVTLLHRRKKSDSPGKLTKQLAGGEPTSSSMGDRSTNASAIFPSNNNSTANLSRVPTLVGAHGLARSAISVPGFEMNLIKPSAGDFENDSAKAWCEALTNGDMAALTSQLKSENGCEVDRIVDDQNHTGLMFAAQEGRDDIVRLLLNNRADLKNVDIEGRSPLIWAASWGRESTVTMLLDRGAIVDHVDKRGWTAIMYSASLGFEGIVDRLLDSGAKYLTADRRLPSPLQLAARNGFTAVVQTLVDRYPQVEHLNWADYRGWSALTEAAANGRLDVLRLLLDRGADILTTDENRRTIIHVASLRGHIDIVRFILNLKKEMIDAVDAFGATPLLVALDQSRVDVAGLLIIKGADLKKQDREGFTPAHVATLAGSVETLKVLCKSDKNILEAWDFRGRTPLLLAAGQGNLEVVKFLVNEGVNTKCTDQLGRNAIMLAAIAGHSAIVKYLLEKQPALINVTDNNCNPPVDLAGSEQVRTLLSATPYNTEHYVTERLDKINRRTRELASYKPGVFESCDEEFSVIRSTMRKSRPDKVLKFVTKVLASAVTRPLCDFDTVDPPAMKIQALVNRITAEEQATEPSIEEQVDAVRHRGRLLIMMNERCHRKREVMDAVAGRIEQDSIKPVVASIQDLEGQIAWWQEQKKTLAEEREAYSEGLQNLVQLIEPIKIRFGFQNDGVELKSLELFEKEFNRQSDIFHSNFSEKTSDLSEDVNMLQIVLRVIETQTSQMGAKFGEELSASIKEFDQARGSYNEAWSKVHAQVEAAFNAVSKQLADTQAQFELISAQNPLGEIRKSYLTVLNRLDAERAFHERLLQRLSAVQEDVALLAPPAMANSNAVQQQEVDGAESIVAAAEGTETADSAPPSNEQAAEEAPVPRETAFDAAKAAERSDKYKSLFFFEQDTLRAAEGEDSQGSASSRIAPVLKASSVTEMVVPPELVVEVPIVTASDAGLGVAGDSIPVVAITPFSRGSSLQDIVVPDAVGESPVSEASDATLLKGSAPKVPARPRKASAGKGPEGVPSIIPARFVQSLANAEAGKSASIRAMRDSHSVSKMLKQFEQASVADESIPSPRSRSVSGQRP